MNGSLPPYLLFFAAIIVSASVSLYAVKKIIFITRHRRLYDIPDNIRKIHGAQIASLGGIGIFIGYIVAAAFFMVTNLKGWNYMLVSSVVLFFTGIYDDIMNMRPSKKLLAQLIASGVAVYFADMRIVSLYGLFGIGDLPYWVSVAVTSFCCTFFINVFNFIDGIDGLACCLAILYTGIIGALFAAMSLTGIACIAFSLLGATAGLLYYNVAPARIYMGDTGSMLLGFTIFVLAVLFVNAYQNYSTLLAPVIHSGPAAVTMVFAILFLPIFDALRVFILRMSRGISPLKADRTHLHYYLLDAGFSHSQSVLVIVTTNVLTILLAYFMQDEKPLLALGGITLFLCAVLLIIYILRQKNLAKVKNLSTN